MLAASTTETRIGKVLNGFDAELQALVNAVDICRHGKEHRVLPVATLLDGVEVLQLLVGFRFQSSNFLNSTGSVLLITFPSKKLSMTYHGVGSLLCKAA